MLQMIDSDELTNTPAPGNHVFVCKCVFKGRRKRERERCQTVSDSGNNRNQSEVNCVCVCVCVLGDSPDNGSLCHNTSLYQQG